MESSLCLIQPITNAKKPRPEFEQDLTPSESRAAYEIRRREQRNRWQDHSQPQPPEVSRSDRPAACRSSVSTGRVANGSTSRNVDQPAQDTTAASSVASIARTARTSAAVGSVTADAVLQSIYRKNPQIWTLPRLMIANVCNLRNKTDDLAAVFTN